MCMQIHSRSDGGLARVRTHGCDPFVAATEGASRVLCVTVVHWYARRRRVGIEEVAKEKHLPTARHHLRATLGAMSAMYSRLACTFSTRSEINLQRCT